MRGIMRMGVGIRSDCCVYGEQLGYYGVEVWRKGGREWNTWDVVF